MCTVCGKWGPLPAGPWVQSCALHVCGLGDSEKEDTLILPVDCGPMCKFSVKYFCACSLSFKSG